MKEPTVPSRDIVQRLARTAGPAIVLAAGGVMLAWTWFKWPDPIVDFGRELYVPWQITEGKVLYRDVAYFNGPLSPYFNAMVFQLLGVSLQSLVIGNLAILGLIVLMVWRLWATIADHVSALLASVTLVVVFAFIQLSMIGNYNFVTPYSHELTHGIALSLAGMLCVGSYLKRQRDVSIAGAGLLLGLVFLTKPEVFVAAAVALTAGVIFGLRWQRSSGGRALQTLTQFGLSALVAPLVALVFLMRSMPGVAAFRGTIGAWIYLFDPTVTGMKFYQRVFGTFDVANNLHDMAVSFIWCGVVFAVAAGVGLALRMPAARSDWMWLPALLVSGIAMWGIASFANVEWSQAFSGLSLIVLITTIGLVIGIARGRHPLDSRRILQLVMALFALLLLGKIFLNVLLYHYGFALAMPGVLVTLALVASWWPNFIDRRGGCGIVLRATAVSAVGLLIYIHLYYYYTLYADKQTLVASGRDAFWADARVDPTRRGHAVNLMLETLERLPRDATLATIPEGVMINYLSRRPNPTPYFNLMPPEVMMFGQDRILAAFQQNPPDYIVYVVGSSPEDYGYRSFDADYGKVIAAWIKEHYRELTVPTEPRYPLVLLRRK